MSDDVTGPAPRRAEREITFRELRNAAVPPLSEAPNDLRDAAGRLIYTGIRSPRPRNSG